MLALMGYLVSLTACNVTLRELGYRPRPGLGCMAPDRPLCWASRSWTWGHRGVVLGFVSAWLFNHASSRRFSGGRAAVPGVRWAFCGRLPLRCCLAQGPAIFGRRCSGPSAHLPGGSRLRRGRVFLYGFGTAADPAGAASLGVYALPVFCAGGRADGGGQHLYRRLQHHDDRV